MTIGSLAAGRQYVFLGRRDGCVIRVEPATKNAVVWNTSIGAIDAISFSPQENKVLAGDEHGRVVLLDTQTGRVQLLPDAHRAPVRSVAYGVHFLVTAGADRAVRLWTTDGVPLATLRMAGPVRKVHLSQDSRSLLVHVDGERGIRRWRLDLLFQEWRKMGLGDGLPAI